MALLNQAGRLPLVSVQRRGGWHFGRMLSTAFDLWREVKKGTGKIQGMRGVMELKATDIPESLIIEAKLDISMPQDERTNAMIAGQLTNPQNPLVSREWASQNILNINQPNEMMDQILKEQMLWDKLQLERQANIQKLQMAMQQQCSRARSSHNSRVCRRKVCRPRGCPRKVVDRRVSPCRVGQRWRDSRRAW